MAHEENADMMMEELELTKKLDQFKHKIMVLSGKGGVGKSTVAANLAISLGLNGFKTGLLDIDFHGPSIPKLLGLEHETIHTDENGINPLVYGTNLKVMSLGMLLKSKDDAVIWRGPMKMGAIKQLIKDVNWGELDYFIIDSPPGTGDEPLSVVQIIKNPTGAVVVTTPQDLSVSDVRRSITFCDKVKLPVLGVIENMSGFICPHCHEKTDIFKSGGGQVMAKDMNVNFLGQIPLEPDIVTASDEGRPYIYYYGKSETAKKIDIIIQNLLTFIGDSKPVPQAEPQPAEPEKLPENIKRYGIPVTDGKLCQHFGHSDKFALIDYDLEQNKIIKTEIKNPPPHEPGILPKWLHEQGVHVIIAGGMGERAKNLFIDAGIEVFIGAAVDTPENLVCAHVKKELIAGENMCDH
ncbi:MAG TPA: iron-sulfur cluster carrier protein MrpORP [bacterium]|nr:iron-sulfur cluster carrier protein MrpORP [bacterium]HPN45377.1 iron-sulfur cluster carrier protein MrpORP [bacterium]